MESLFRRLREKRQALGLPDNMKVGARLCVSERFDSSKESGFILFHFECSLSRAQTRLC